MTLFNKPHVHPHTQLTRFLRAEKLMPQAAATRLANYASWRNDCPMVRRSHTVTALQLYTSPPTQGSIRRDEVPNQIAEGKVYLTDALDKGGRPLMVIQGCKHTVKNRDLEESKRFTIYVCVVLWVGVCLTCFACPVNRVHTMPLLLLCNAWVSHNKPPPAASTAPTPTIPQSLDTMVLRIDPAANADGKMCVLVDMRNVGYANLDAAVLRVAFAVLQNYYPERMHAVWFYDAPTIFWGTWKLVSPFLDPATRQKVHFVYSTDNSAAKLWEEFDRCVDCSCVQCARVLV